MIKKTALFLLILSVVISFGVIPVSAAVFDGGDYYGEIPLSEWEEIENPDESGKITDEVYQETSETEDILAAYKLNTNEKIGVAIIIGSVILIVLFALSVFIKQRFWG